VSAGLITSTETAVLKTLAYFDVFKHPLTLDEIFRFNQEKSTLDHLKDTLSALSEEGKVYTSGPYYMLRDDHQLRTIREENELRAANLMPVAERNGQFISKFPFVQSACLSGSISKNVMAEDADIDYFIISSKGRIWISKFLLTAYKKTLLRHRAEHFCLNYFISEENTKIPDENLFTATELCTLIPLTNTDLYNRLIDTNQWVSDFLPQSDLGLRDNVHLPDPKKTITSRIIEACLFGPIGDLADALAHSFYKYVNRKRYAKKFDRNFDQMFRSTKAQSKIHTSDHQHVILTKYEKICASLNLDN